jgi:hypothetical protein
MANNITGNPWFINAVGTLITQRFKLDGGIWNSAAAGARLQLTDLSGRIILDALFPTDLQPVVVPKIGWVNGVIVTIIGSGNVTIYVGNK